MNNKSIIASFLTLAILISCGPRITQEEHDNFILLHQKGGKSISYCPESGVQLLYDKGYAFKDLNRNGELDVYEDWRKSSEERAADLASQISIEQIAGLMLYSAHTRIPQYSRSKPMNFTYDGKPFSQSDADSSDLCDQIKKAVIEDNLRHILITRISSANVAARFNNKLQALVESLPFGIPTNNSSDPRNETKATDEYNAGSGNTASRWPTPLGLGATFDPEVVRDFGEVVSTEYRALGITTALSPQADIYTEPRWKRGLGTFTEDPVMATDMTRAYIDAFQTTEGSADGWGEQSVNCMVKHWPGGATGEGGRDAHVGFGKYAVFPGGQFQTAADIFINGAFKLDGPTGYASAVMPYYTISSGIDPYNVGNSFSKYIIQDLLIDTYKYKGVVCTDWGITRDVIHVGIYSGKPWGMERKSVAERHYQVLKAGVDQFGGNNDKGPVLEAYKMWCEEFGEESARARFELSAKKLLTNFFRTGVFENPYLIPEETVKVMSSQDFRDRGYLAQLKSIVMLKNHGNVLPIKEKAKVYFPKRQTPDLIGIGGNISLAGKYDYGFDPAILKDYYEFVENPEEADFAIAIISSPESGRGYDIEELKKGGNGYIPMSLQWSDYTATDARAVSLAGGDPDEKSTNRSYRGKTAKSQNIYDIKFMADMRKAMGDKPIIMILTCQKPVVFTDVEKYADAIIISFGVESKAYLDVMSGRYEPSGLLPVQFPADMKTVEAQFEDAPRDMECYKDADGNVYDFAFGMNWSGVIDDDRVQRYR